MILKTKKIEHTKKEAYRFVSIVKLLYKPYVRTMLKNKEDNTRKTFVVGERQL